jgi:hypothetical protein
MPPHVNTRTRRNTRHRGPDPNAPIKYAIAFLRESTAEQEEGYSPETQLEETRRCASDLGYVIPDEFVFKVTVKGRRLERTKEYQEALELIIVVPSTSSSSGISVVSGARRPLGWRCSMRWTGSV